LGDDEDSPVVSDSSMERDVLVAFNPRGFRNISAVDEAKNMG
jgi:hypothetical protein